MIFPLLLLVGIGLLLVSGTAEGAARPSAPVGDPRVPANPPVRVVDDFTDPTDPEVVEPTGPEVAEPTDPEVVEPTDPAGAWYTRYLACPYHDLIADTETAREIPTNLLARLLWQESRFNPRPKPSSAGALGIAQFMPAMARAYNVDPMSPESAIPGAADLLCDEYAALRSWPLALAAYNAGRKVAKRDPDTWPTETKNYVAEITADVAV